MKKKEQMKTWRGLAMVALALGVSLTACETEKPNCPARNEQSQTQEEPGVEVLIEAVNTVTGETTRSANWIQRPGYSFSAYGQGGDGDVQVKGVGHYPATSEKPDVNVNLTFYAKENIVFKRWGWRYYEESTSKMTDAPALQVSSGLDQLAHGKQGFQCKYREGTHNKVYVKIEYEKVLGEFKKLPDVHLTLFPYDGYVRAGGRSFLTGYEETTHRYTYLHEAMRQKEIGRELYNMASQMSTGVPQMSKDQFYDRFGIYKENYDEICQGLMELGNIMERNMWSLASALEGVNKEYMIAYDNSPATHEKYKEKLRKVMKEMSLPIAEKLDSFHSVLGYLPGDLRAIANVARNTTWRLPNHTIISYFADRFQWLLAGAEGRYDVWFYLKEK